MKVLLSGIGIIGWSQVCPSRKVTNQELAAKLGVDAKLIEAQTGIKERYYLGASQTPESLAMDAAEKALKKAGIQSKELDRIICGTTSASYRFPAMACRIQQALKTDQAFSFDIASSSTSFQVGLDLAADYLKSHPEARYVLLVVCAVQSPFINWKDPKLAVILADGAAAVVVGRVRQGEGILRALFSSNGNLSGAALLKDSFIHMDGVAMGREFLKTQSAMILKILKLQGWTPDQLDCLIFHQANARLIELLMKQFKIPLSKTVLTVTRRGNTAEASVPTTLAEALEQKKISSGKRVLLSSVGAGSSCAATLIRW